MTAASELVMAKGSVSSGRVADIIDDFAFDAYQFLQHDIEPLTVYCHVRKRGFGKESALRLCEKYETFVYPFARGMSHLIRAVFDNDGRYEDRIRKEMYKSQRI